MGLVDLSRMLKSTTLFMTCLLLSAAALAQHLTMNKIGDGLFVHISYHDYNGSPYSANGLVVETRDGVVIIDTPWDTTQTRQLLRWIDTNLHKPVRLCIATHSHADRTAGAPILKSLHIPMATLALTAQKMQAEGLPAPDVILPADTTLRIGGVTLNVFFPGAGHVEDNLVVYLPKWRLLAGGCFVKSTQADNLGYIQEANLGAWPTSLMQVRKRFPRIHTIIPGHEGWQGDGIAHTLRLLEQHESKGN